jgi:hypothetical protein
VLVPTRVAVVAALLVLAHLHNAEHAAHADSAERPGARHHGGGVVGQRHLHLGHVLHAALAHHHVVGDQLGDLLGHAAVVHADHGRHVVAHRVHRVVALVAVEGPVALLVGEEVHLPHLPHRDVGRHLVLARALRRRPAVGAGDQELVPVQVDRVVGHRQVADADAHLVHVPHHQRVDAREDAAVPAPQVEVQHRHDLRRVAAGIDVVGVEQEAEVAVDLVDQRVLCLRVRDPEAHHPHRHLHHLVGVRVVHEGAGRRATNS